MPTCRGWLVACLTAAALLAPQAAFALDVDSVTDTVVDPVKPVADDVIDGVKDAADDATTQIEEQVDPVLDRVRDPVDEIVEDIVGPVRDVTDPVVDDEVIDTVTGGVLGGGAKDATRPDTTTTTADRREARRTAATAKGAAPAANTTAPRNRRDPAPGKSRAEAVRAAGAQPPVNSPGGSVADVIADASRAFAFPLVIVALILLFLAVQHRIDARDPKLADGFDDEELTFA